jgi:hypothetical protein
VRPAANDVELDSVWCAARAARDLLGVCVKNCLAQATSACICRGDDNERVGIGRNAGCCREQQSRAVAVADAMDDPSIFHVRFPLQLMICESSRPKPNVASFAQEQETAFETATESTSFADLSFAQRLIVVMLKRTDAMRRFVRATKMSAAGLRSAQREIPESKVRATHMPIGRLRGAQCKSAKFGKIRR